MADETKKGLWGKIFRVQKTSNCCSLQIEEVPEAELPALAPAVEAAPAGQGTAKKAEVASKSQR